jgi:hypothetical protein
MADYKTIKDLPGLAAGAIFRLDEKAQIYRCVYSKEGEQSWTFRKETMEKNPDWFEVAK